ncbi:MAG: bifunctional pyr operon transcriptional regulator/uracil phosphoribosyltransferase PyrR [Gammaproteobacteria bacterium]|nr:bifunctional pyr operon transcriptional regulator/uracil phosphoribosyltransferase PyrR [Gammaproteobacteria bacterium]
MNDKEINRHLDGMSKNLEDFINANHRSDPLMVGIHTGGHWIASKLNQRLQQPLPQGELNIAFYRDDFSRIGMHPRVEPSKLPFEVEARHIILVDDVLHTGRTIRAAMNEIFDYGRPATITLAVLVERSGHELPIKADIVGKTLQLKPFEHVKLLGPEPLALEIKQQHDG